MAVQFPTTLLATASCETETNGKFKSERRSRKIFEACSCIRKDQAEPVSVLDDAPVSLVDVSSAVKIYLQYGWQWHPENNTIKK